MGELPALLEDAEAGAAAISVEHREMSDGKLS